MLGQLASHKRIDTVSLHLYKVPRVVPPRDKTEWWLPGAAGRQVFNGDRPSLWEAEKGLKMEGCTTM